jgi:DNA-binding transcriptional LysR family regulator
VQSLEDALGAKLFHRHARGLALTHEGERLLEATRLMADEIDRARMASRRRATGRPGRSS